MIFKRNKKFKENFNISNLYFTTLANTSIILRNTELYWEESDIY